MDRGLGPDPLRDYSKLVTVVVAVMTALGFCLGLAVGGCLF